MNEIRETLFAVADESWDPMVKAEAVSLANFEVGNFEFILATIIRYDILFAVNTVSKSLQSADMQLDVPIQQIKGLVTYLTKCRDAVFHSAMITAKEIASAMDVEQVFKQNERDGGRDNLTERVRMKERYQLNKLLERDTSCA